MLCENCGKNHANVRYTQIINGVKKEISLCEECSRKLGIGNVNFDMPIDFSSFLGDFMEDWNDEELFPAIGSIKQQQCPNCKTTFEKIMNSGKLGCAECYETFEDRIDEILKNIHGANRHIGRIGKIRNEPIVLNKDLENTDKPEVNKTSEANPEKSKIDELQLQLKKAIKEERYEEAAKIRDEIKAESNNKK